MNTDDKILKTLVNIQASVSVLQKGQKTLTNGQKRLEDGQKSLKADVSILRDVQQKQGKQIDILVDGLSHTNTAIKTLATKHDVEEIVDAKVDAAKSELKEDILMLDAKVSKVVKKVQSHDRRITNIEEREGIENPDKN